MAMQVFVRRLSYFLIIQGCIWGGVLALYKQYKAINTDINETGYLAATIDKHHLLMQQPSPRMVFVGGSNLAFGLDSSQIEQYLGYQPVNMGLNVALGLDFMLAEVEPFLKRGDVVLISPEYEHFVDLYSGDAGALFTEIELQPHSIQFLTGRNLAMLLDHGLIIAGSITRRSIDFGIRILQGEVQSKPRARQGLYQRSGFNQLGDVIAHRNLLATQDIHVEKYRPSTPDSIERVINRLNKFNHHCQRKGILVFYSYPPLFQENLQANADMIHEIAFKLSKQLTFPLLDTPEEMSFPLDYFFNHPYHLNAFGLHIRTEHLIEKLRDQLAHVSPASPHM
jgi:hypothetical protein